MRLPPHERARRKFVQRCRYERAQAVEHLLFLRGQARYDSDPDLLHRIEDHQHFINLIDQDLAKAGIVIH